MLNKSGVRTSSFTGPTQILADVDYQYGVGCIVDKDLGTDGIVRAGTPIRIDTLNTQTPVVAGTEQAAANAVLIHDVDVSNGNANGSALLVGAVNLNRVHDDVATLLEAAADADNKVGTVQLVKL